MSSESTKSESNDVNAQPEVNAQKVDVVTESTSNASSGSQSNDPNSQKPVDSDNSSNSSGSQSNDQKPVDSDNSSNSSSESESESKDNTPKKTESLASILRKTAAQEFITQQLRQQLASLTGELAEKCNDCNTINPTEWKENKCTETCIPLENNINNNRGLFQKRSELLNTLENVTTTQLSKIFPDREDRRNFYNKYFYETLKQTGSFEDSMIDMNDKLETFIDKVNVIFNDYSSKDTELTNSTDDKIKKNTQIKINYDKSPVEFFFKPLEQSFDTYASLDSQVSSLTEDEMYCKRKKFLSCAIRSHKCEWKGDRNDLWKCELKGSSGASNNQGTSGQGTNQLPTCAGGPTDPGIAAGTCQAGGRNISKHKKKVIRNLSKRRYF